MKEIFYAYNNEAIGSCVILSLLNKVDSIDLAKMCLVLPFLLDDRTVKHLQNSVDQEITIESLIESQPRLFASYNNRFLSLLPVTINSLIILNKNDQISVRQSISIKNKIGIDNDSLGERFNRINKVLPLFINIIKDQSAIQLYKTLNIKL